jgi:hypothetical protein
VKRVQHKVALAAVVGGATAVAAGVVAVVVLAFGAGPAAAEPPSGGLFGPGKSLAGVGIGMKERDVLGAWGERHGVCRECPEATWYFNERPFQPQGTGAVFAHGRVVHAFTLWQPGGWTTPAGLELGDEGARIGEVYGLLAERACAGYTALVREEGKAWSIFYVYENEVWGFGLVKPGRSPCL